MSIGELALGLGKEDLRRLTNAMVDTMLGLIAECEDADVTFVPQDPQANDPYAAQDTEQGIAWTLGHVIVHCTASSEEAAALAAELARGLPNTGRSRYEVHWSTMHTVAQLRQRLEESRRMRLAFLEAWPDQPNLDNLYESTWAGKMNCAGRFLLGLMHDDSHLDQIRDVTAQARTARG